jgi:peptide deformylase
MAILPIIEAPDPRLKRISVAVESINDELRKLIRDMFETMYHAGGIGLAAVQVGVHQRVLVMDLARDQEDPAPMALINPAIIFKSESLSPYEEGCLSFPGLYTRIERPKEIIVEYMDLDGQQRRLEATGLLATCVQHEIDHLDGIVFVDHISPLRRDMLMRKLTKKSNK